MRIEMRIRTAVNGFADHRLSQPRDIFVYTFIKKVFINQTPMKSQILSGFIIFSFESG